MKALTPFTPTNSTSAPGNLSHLYINNKPQSNDSFQARVNKTTEGKHPAYVAGELANRAYHAASSWVSKLYHSLPEIGFPGAEAKIPVAAQLSDDALLDKALKITTVVGANNDAQKEKALEIFEEAFLKAIKGESITKDSIGLWLDSNVNHFRPSIELHLTQAVQTSKTNIKAEVKHIQEGGFEFKNNQARISIYMGVERLTQILRHELGGHAADFWRYILAVVSNEASNNPGKTIPPRGLEHYMKDISEEESRRLIAACKSNVTAVHNRVKACLHSKGDECSDPTLQKINTSYPMSISYPQKKIPNVTYDPGERVVVKDVEYEVVDIDGNQQRLLVHGKLESFNRLWEQVLQTIKAYEPYSRSYETSAYLTQALPDAMKGEICPDLSRFEDWQNKEARRSFERIMQQMSGGGRDDL